MLTKPTLTADIITDITDSMLKSINVDSLILDVDNTLSAPGKQMPFEGSVKWAKNMSKLGYKLIIVSNNFKKRVAPFAAKYNLPFIYMALKPFPFSYITAVKKLNSKKNKTVIIGDQIFTDIVGANLIGIKSILLNPQVPDKGFSISIRRAMEKNIRKNLK